MGVVVEVEAGGIVVASADRLDLSLEYLGVCLRGVQPVTAAMGV